MPDRTSLFPLLTSSIYPTPMPAKFPKPFHPSSVRLKAKGFETVMTWHISYGAEHKVITPETETDTVVTVSSRLKVQPTARSACNDVCTVAATTSACRRELEPECWICLSGEEKVEAVTGKSEVPVQMCSCPRKVHPSCLKTWQRTKIGTHEEVNP